MSKKIEYTAELKRDWSRGEVEVYILRNGREWLQVYPLSQDYSFKTKDGAVRAIRRFAKESKLKIEIIEV
jgi:hypothetical protein